MREYKVSIDELLTQHTILFQREVDDLTNPQANFLKALCDDVPQFSAAETLRKSTPIMVLDILHETMIGARDQNGSTG